MKVMNSPLPQPHSCKRERGIIQRTQLRLSFPSLGAHVAEFMGQISIHNSQIKEL